MFILNPYTAKPNTIIGGVGSVITTKSALATKLEISASRISRFEIVGSDIECRISGNYLIPVNAFYTNTDITKHIDLDGLVTNINGAGFFQAANLTEVSFENLTGIALNGMNGTGVESVSFPSLTEAGAGAFESSPNMVSAFLPNLISIPARIFYNNTSLASVDLSSATSGNQRMFYNTKIVILDLPQMVNISAQTATFRAMSMCEEINMPKLKALGSASVHDDCFTALKTGCIIKVNVFMATSNSGSPHAALAWVKANRGATVEFYDDFGNYVSTL